MFIINQQLSHIIHPIYLIIRINIIAIYIIVLSYVQYVSISVLVLGQYLPTLVFEQFIRIFQVNKAQQVLKQLDGHVYARLHQQLLDRITKKNDCIYRRSLQISISITE